MLHMLHLLAANKYIYIYHRVNAECGMPLAMCDAHCHIPQQLGRSCSPVPNAARNGMSVFNIAADNVIRMLMRSAGKRKNDCGIWNNDTNSMHFFDSHARFNDCGYWKWTCTESERMLQRRFARISSTSWQIDCVIRNTNCEQYAFL